MELKSSFDEVLGADGSHARCALLGPLACGYKAMPRKTEAAHFSGPSTVSARLEASSSQERS